MKTIDKSKVLVGSDFEMFLQSRVDDKIISAIPFLNGTKTDPERLEREGCCTQHDGVLTECNVPPVGLDGALEFIDNVNFVKEHIKKTVLEPNNFRLICCPTAELDDDQLLDPEAVRMGCDPDFNAWDGGNINEKPTEFPGPVRSCGAHVHLSYPGANVTTSMNLMKLFDLFVTLPLTLIDTDTRRRELYGKAGAFRLQNWGDSQGFEARTLSNIWIGEKKLIKYVFNQLNAMFDYYNTKGMRVVNKDADKIVKAINESDSELAVSLCDKYDIKMVKQVQLV